MNMNLYEKELLFLALQTWRFKCTKRYKLSETERFQQYGRHSTLLTETA